MRAAVCGKARGAAAACCSGLRWQLSVLAAAVVMVGGFVVAGARGQRGPGADEVDCSKYKCVALTFDDGPTHLLTGC